jgi:hypothetical protein
LEVSGQLHTPAALPPGRISGTHWIGGWVDPIAGLDDVKKRKFLTLLARLLVNVIRIIQKLFELI